MRSRLLIPGLFTAISLIILAALGAWQWRRRGEKLDLIATVQDRIGRAPVPFPAVAEWPKLDLAPLSYLPVSLTGTFDHGREAHVFFSLSPKINGIGGPGYLIFTPFHLNAGGTVLINRGFVPMENKAAASRAAGQSAGEQTITGLVRLPEPRGSFSGADDPVKNVYYVRDPMALAAALQLGPVAPVMVDLKTPAPPGGLPLPGVTQINIPNNHWQYAMTWWGLGLVLLVIFVIYARGKAD